MALPFQPAPTLPAQADSPANDPDFLRHHQALASHLSATPSEVLQPTRTSGATTLSHW